MSQVPPLPIVVTKSCVEILPADLPLSCPVKGAPLWNAHPQVYLPIADTGYAVCPYCGAEFVLKNIE
jgi:uncharacterized Zn-finger protein